MGKSNIRKSRKKYWKRVRVSDVERQLHEERDRIRTCGDFSGTSDSQLFEISNSASTSRHLDSSDSQAFLGVPTASRKLKDSAARTALLPRSELLSLKCFSHLAPRSKQPPLLPGIRSPNESSNRSVKRKRIKEKNCRFEELHSVISENSNAPAETITRAALPKPARRNGPPKKIGQRRKVFIRSSDIYDVWNPSPHSNSSEDSAPSEPPPNMRGARKAPSRDRRLKYVPSKLPTISVPHPGSSYNPDPESHKSLLWDAHHAEERRVRERKELEKKVEAMYKAEPFSEEKELQEMSAGLGLYAQSESEKAEEQVPEGEGEQEDLSDSTTPQKRINTPMHQRTRASRRHEQEQLEKMKAKARGKEERIFNEEFKQISRIRRNIVRNEQRLSDRLANRRRRQQQHAEFEVKKLSRVRFEEPVPDFTMKSDLPGYFRRIRPEGNLLRDHMKNLERRNFIQPHVRTVKGRKYPLKKYFKRGVLTS